MDTLKHCFITIVFSCLCSQMSNVASVTAQLQYGATCTETTQCLTSDAVCNASNICACYDTHYYDMDNNTYTEKVDYAANCTDITDCITSNAICNGSGTCACNDTHYYDTANDTCTEKQVFGGVCSETSQCDTSDSNIECTQTSAEKKCLCKYGWYRPNTSCVQFKTFNLAISNTATIGPNSINVNWTNDDVPGGYTVSYTVDWSPGSTGAVTTTQRTYNISPLSAGTPYAVTVALQISKDDRSQQVEMMTKTFSTKQTFGGVCSDTSQCDLAVDSNIQCIDTTESSKKCLCTNGFYRPSSACEAYTTFNLTISNTATIGPNSIDVSWTNDDVTGNYTVSYTVSWLPGSTVAISTPQKNYNISPLSAGTPYTVTVALNISRYNRSQQVEMMTKTFSTKQTFGGVCSDTSQCDLAVDSNIQCIDTTESNKKCLCTNGFYRPSSACEAYTTFNLTISNTATIGPNSIDVSWTNDDVTGNYTVSYTVSWLPGSTVAISTPQKNYNISPLSAGTPYTVTVALNISRYNRSQQVEMMTKTFSTKQVFGGECSDTSNCDTASDSNIQCIPTTESNMKCLCRDKWYRPSAACQEYGQLKPAISNTATLGTDNIVISWENTDVTGGYSFSYSVAWSPGSSVTAPTPPKTYKIRSLSQGTAYTVTVTHTITQHGRSQEIASVTRTFTTKIGYNENCTQNGSCFGENTNCYVGRCRCDPGYYREAICTSIEQLRPTSVAANVTDTTTLTASWVSLTNAVISGFEVSVTPGNITPISEGRDIRTTPITGLTPGRQYNVSVKTKITYLQGRDEKTDAVPATTQRTKPAAIMDLDSKTNRTAPNITIVFAKAEGDADKYIVTLSGRDGDTYNQRHEPPNGSGQDLISVVFTGVVAAKSYTLTIQTQSGDLLSSTYTTVIQAQATPAGIVSNLKSINSTSRSVAIEWQKPVDPNGYIYEYIVDVKKGAACEKRVIINCTECNRTSGNLTKPQMQIQCETNMTVVISQANIENKDHAIQHNVTGLNPDTSYTIVVVAVNEEGAGALHQVSYHTPEEAAGEPTNFTAQSKSSSEITLTWDPPQPRPGVTQYNLTVYEKQEEGEGYDTLRTIHFSDWATKTYTISNLSSYWSYKADIVAQTRVGPSAIVNGMPATTMESEPINVTNFKIEKVPDVFNKIQVSWTCPKQKDGRNGVILNANLHYFSNQQATFLDPVSKNINFSNINRACVWEETVQVTTEFTYQFQVRLYNRGFAGSIFYASRDIEGGPPLLSEVMYSVTKGTVEAEETVSLAICPKCLYDRTNGQVNTTGLIVCKKGGNCEPGRKRRATNSAAVYDNMDNWNVASADSFNRQYRATKKDWLDGNNEKSTLAFTVGEKDCSGNPKGEFCNGKLPAGETFIVYAFTCTKQGCTTSQRIEVNTKASIVLGAVVGAVVVAVVAIVVVIVVVIFRRRRNAKMKQADPSEIEAGGDLILRKRPIKMKDFEKRVEEMHKDSNLLYSEEFEDIGALSPKHTCTASETGGNKLRNRYVNILPFDHSRVKLRSTGDDDDDETDYINANYIPGYNSPREFIATQGPMTGTVADFWRMIWEQDVNIIIMLSDLLEKGKPKVDRYWPENMKEAVQYGEIVVEMINYSPLNKYIMKIFQITVGDESRKVRHYFLPGWQDFGANLTPDDVISFVRDVRMQKKPTDKGPICVHCSAGVGRTGTYVSLDVFKQAIDEENFDKELDVFDFVMKMRENRSYMVQTEKQYIFIHDTIKEMLIRKKKEIAERDNIYQNSDLKPEENIYANQAYEPDPEELYMNVKPGQPTTVL